MTENHQEAKRLIEDAFSDVDLDVDGTPCPLGDDCSIHHRVDERVLIEDGQYGRIITYVGDYVVITEDNPELSEPLVIMRLALGMMKQEDIPPLYETCVIHVGEGGTLADLRNADQKTQASAVRFAETHNSWDNFEEAHNVVLSGVQGGEIDLSKSIYPEGE